MKKALIYSIVCTAATLGALSPKAHGNLLVTEVNSNLSGGNGDFWELTNFGSTAVDLFTGSTPWKWNDSSTGDTFCTLPLGISIAPGESIVFLADQTDAAAFRTVWGISNSVQVIPDNSATGLGNTGDAVTLFDDLNQVVVTFEYGANKFTRSNGTASVAGHAGVSAGGAANQSAIWDPNFGTTSGTARYTAATGSNFGSFTPQSSSGFSGAGSPGLVSVTPVPEPTSAVLLASSLLLVNLRRRRR